MTTTTKRGPGRPPTKKATPKPQSSSVKVRRDIPQNQVREYRTTEKSTGVFLMQQRGITIFDKEENRIREIRYCPNEPSIYRDEQSESARREPIIFNGGVLMVPPEKPNLIEFMDAHPRNKANGGGDFYLVNKQEKAKIEVDQEFLVADAITMVRDKDLDSLLSVAVAVGINVDREVAEIKHDLLVFAKRNPGRFIESFDNPAVEMKTKLTMAEKYQIVKLSPSGVYWTDSGKLIVSVPAGKDPLDVFVRFCLTEAAVPVVEEIDKQLNR